MQNSRQVNNYRETIRQEFAMESLDGFSHDKETYESILNKRSTNIKKFLSQAAEIGINIVNATTAEIQFRYSALQPDGVKYNLTSTIVSKKPDCKLEKFEEFLCRGSTTVAGFSNHNGISLYSSSYGTAKTNIAVANGNGSVKSEVKNITLKRHSDDVKYKDSAGTEKKRPKCDQYESLLNMYGLANSAVRLWSESQEY